MLEDLAVKAQGGLVVAALEAAVDATEEMVGVALERLDLLEERVTGRGALASAEVATEELFRPLLFAPSSV